MEGKSGQMVTFYLGPELFGIGLDCVREIIRVPEMVRVPGTPPYFSGLANLRGSILPVVDARQRFGLPQAEYTESTRVIVLEREGEALGLIVDKMSEVFNLEGAVEEPLHLAEGHEEFVSRVVRPDGGKMVMEVNLDVILPSLEGSRREEAAGFEVPSSRNNGAEAAGEEEIRQFVGFKLAGEEYAVAIENVQEIVWVPEKISRSPGFPPYMDGLFSLRQRTVPLVNLRKYLSFPERPYDERSRVIVINVKGSGENRSVFGLGVDAVTEVLRLSVREIGPLPELLGGGSNGCLKGLCRLGEDRLIYILDPAAVSAICQVGADAQEEAGLGERLEERAEEDQFVIFHLAGEDYALAISRVKEIIRLPRIAAVPGAPPYIEGLVNIRGSILPVINLRRKLGLPGKEHDERARIVVVDFEGTPTGLIVDAVREVLKIAQEQIEEVPHALKPLKGASCLSGIAVQGEGRRSVLLLDLESTVNASEREEVSRLAEEAAAKGLLQGNPPDQPAGGKEEKAGEDCEL